MPLQFCILLWKRYKLK
ncbi:hypothetical protein DPMN_064822 [Dreissena polymorpha]|uniref:Uncharacterized protein n=1 Tax=Dreissena polymorpha TaxID=45954 RepID=A0A9D4CEA9_DREPO|nr:hypothetical protein DPMN_064822 [Dreissena polymorpha]